MIVKSQHRFTSVKSCMTNLIAVCDEMAGCVVKGKAVVMFFILTLVRCPLISLDITKVIYGLNNCLMTWVENWLDKQAPSGTESSWWPVASGVPQELILRLIHFSIFTNDLNDGTVLSLQVC